MIAIGVTNYHCYNNNYNNNNNTKLNKDEVSINSYLSLYYNIILYR